MLPTNGIIHKFSTRYINNLIFIDRKCSYNFHEQEGKYPDWAFLVLDEAYSSLGDDHHLTPFSRAQLRKSRATSERMYLKMKAFNNMLSCKCS